MKKRIALVFDMDGTLWDCTESIKNAGNEIIERKKGWKNHLNMEMVHSVMGLELEELAQVYFPTLEKEERMALVDELCANENSYLSVHGGKLYPKLEETLKELSKYYDLMIVTNAQDGYVEAMFASHPLQSYFIDYETYGHTMKPKGENIRLILERNHVEQAYYIGDTQKDLEACKMANVPFVYASYGFGEVSQYDAKIDCFEELLTLFKDGQGLAK